MATASILRPANLWLREKIQYERRALHNKVLIICVGNRLIRMVTYKQLTWAVHVSSVGEGKYVLVSHPSGKKEISRRRCS